MEMKIGERHELSGCISALMRSKFCLQGNVEGQDFRTFCCRPAQESPKTSAILTDDFEDLRPGEPGILNTLLMHDDVAIEV